jgi:hypothetical protein
VDESFQIINRMPVDTCPILRQQPGHTPEYVGGGMSNLDERQQKESGSVGKKPVDCTPKSLEKCNGPTNRET